MLILTSFDLFNNLYDFRECKRFPALLVVMLEIFSPSAHTAPPKQHFLIKYVERFAADFIILCCRKKHFYYHKMAEGKKEVKKKLPRLGFWEVWSYPLFFMFSQKPELNVAFAFAFIRVTFQEFMIGGIAAGISKTASAPIERVKLMVQNQDEMIKAGRLTEPYKGMTDCFRRVQTEEGFACVNAFLEFQCQWARRLANTY